MNLISKSIYAPDVEADDRLIASMQSNRYSGEELRDIIVARYRNRNLRMRVLVAFNQTVKSKKIANEVNAAIKAIDTKIIADDAALSAIAAVLDADNVVSIEQASATKKKRAGKKDRKVEVQSEQKTA